MKEQMPKDWTDKDVNAILKDYRDNTDLQTAETLRIANGIGGYYARSLGDALSLDADLRRHKNDYRLSVVALIDSLVETKKTINAGDVRDILAVGRAVRVGKVHGFDLVAGQVSLTSARYIGLRLPKLEEAKDSKAIKALFRAAMAGKDVSKVLPKVERKAKGDKTEKAEGENKTETTIETRPATADELATAVMSRLNEVSEPVKIALFKAISASIKASSKATGKASSKATGKASEPVAIPETMKATG
jgi:hypothetical protein